MPNSIKYQRIKNDPARYENFKAEKRLSSRKYRRIHVFKKLALRHNVRCKRIKITASQLFGIAKRQRLICPFTGEKMTIETISLDHILPLSKGGTNKIDNLRFVTKNVNNARRNLTDKEFYQMCKSVTYFFV